MSKERLEEIKELLCATLEWTIGYGSVVLEREILVEIEDLIFEQAERTAELEEENKRYHDLIKTLANPDSIAREVHRNNPEQKYVDANHMVTWVVNEASKALAGDSGS